MRADLLYQTTYQNNIYENFLFSEDTESLLFELGILYFGYKNDMTRFEKSLEKTKVELFQQYFDTTKRTKIKFKIKGLKEDIDDFYSKQHSLDYLTIDHYCDNIKHEFIISNTLYFYDSKELVFKEDVDSNLFNQIVTQISKNMIGLHTYKSIARSDYWRNYWNNNKNNILDEPVKEWSEEQKSLINISCMYDKIYEHPECPKELVFGIECSIDSNLIAALKLSPELLLLAPLIV